MTFDHSGLVTQQKCNYELGLLSPPPLSFPNCPFLLHLSLEFLTAFRGVAPPTLGTTVSDHNF